jgi:hypothetical protein
MSIEQKIEPLTGAQPEMVLAFGADLGVAIEVFLPNDGAAIGTLDP